METTIEQYNNLHKRIVSDSIELQPTESDLSIFPSTSKKFCKIESDSFNNRIHHFIYVIDVGELAKKNFVRFGLGGPVAHPEVGGRYLRLYGALSAVYQQKVAIENLLELYKIEEKEKITHSLNNSSIIDLCNKLGVHATYLKNSLADPEELLNMYEISRPDLEVNKVKVLVRKLEFEIFDLIEDLKSFDRRVELTLSFIIGKILRNHSVNHSSYVK